MARNQSFVFASGKVRKWLNFRVGKGEGLADSVEKVRRTLEQVLRVETYFSEQSSQELGTVIRSLAKQNSTRWGRRAWLRTFSTISTLCCPSSTRLGTP